MARRGGGCLTAIGVVLSVAVFLFGVALVYVVATDQVPSPEPDMEESSDALEPAAFSDYSWEELAQIAEMIAEAPTDEEGLAIAEQWGIEVGSVRPLPLDDGRQATLTVVGIRCDERADGNGTAGITFMTSPIAVQPMNSTATNEGGWEASELRAWLASDGAELLPDELAANALSVVKYTNNDGDTADVSSVTQTEDTFWLFSLSEVCGEIDLFAEEYGDEVRARTYYIDYTTFDAVLSAEGAQYPYFAQEGVTCLSDPNGVLALDYSGSPSSWWYRSAYPSSFNIDDNFSFYQVMEGGYPSSLGSAEQDSGVVVGFCL